MKGLSSFYTLVLVCFFGMSGANADAQSLACFDQEYHAECQPGSSDFIDDDYVFPDSSSPIRSAYDTTPISPDSLSRALPAYAIWAAGHAAVFGVWEGTAYAWGWFVGWHEWDGYHFGGRVAAGVVEGCVIAISCRYDTVPDKVLAFGGKPGIAGAIGDLLGDTVRYAVATISKPGQATFGNIKEALESIGDDIAGAVQSVMDQIESQPGDNPPDPYTVGPFWADFSRDQITTSSGLTVDWQSMVYRSDGQAWAMTTNNQSKVSFAFSLDRIPSHLIMTITHLSSAAAGAQGGGYSPIDVRVNGALVKDDFDVAENHGGSHGMEQDIWEITPYLMTGSNSVTIQLGNAQTQYWVLSAGFSTGLVLAEGMNSLPPRVVSSVHSNARDTNVECVLSPGNYAGFETFQGHVTVVGSSSGTHAATLSWNAAQYKLTINPNTDFSYGETVTVTLGTGIKDLAGNQLDGDGNGTPGPAYTLTFVVESTPQYTISASAGGNGSIDPSGSVGVSSGQTRVFNASPSIGYEVDKWYWNGSPVQTGGTSYTTPAVYANASVYVAFKQDTPSDISITSPVAGMKYYRKSKLTVAWEYFADLGKTVKIELYGNGSLNRVIEGSTFLNNPLYTWTIPTDVPVGTGYQIKVTSIANSLTGLSGSFEISEAPGDDDVIEIRTASDLQNIAYRGHYKLMNDIDLDGFGFVPISAFRGTLDGNGYRIIDLEINRQTEVLVGLFRYTTEDAVIKNLRIDGGWVRGLSSVGAICGEFSGLMVNCHSSADVWGSNTVKSYRVGGLVGENYRGTIRNSSCSSEDVRAYGDNAGGIAGENNAVIEFCWSTVKYVEARDDFDSSVDSAGGIAGENYGTIRECYSQNTQVESDDHYAGGIAGENWGTGSIINCYSLSRTDGEYIGGVVGYNSGGVVSNSYAAGYVNDSSGGGLVGSHSSGVASYCFWDNQTTGKTLAKYSGSGSVVDCYGKPTAEMKQRATFESLGWDFADVWEISEGVSYPTLRAAKPCVSTPSGVSASSDRSDGVQVRWSSVTGAGCYMVFRADSAYGNPQAVSAWVTGTSFLDVSAIEQATHYYWVKAALTAYGAGESELGSPVTGFRLLGPVAAPGSIVASDGELNSIIVVWDSVPRGGFYKLFRAESEGGAKTELTGWITGTSYSDASPVARHNYYYWIKAAADATGARESVFCGPDTGYFRATDNNAPAITISCSPTAPIETQNVLIDVSASDNDLLDRVILHWETPGASTQTWSGLGVAQFIETHTIGSYDAGVDVLVWAEAWDETGNRRESERRGFRVAAETVSTPPPPTGPHAVALNQPFQYTVASCVTTLGAPVEYQYDWGDGTGWSSWGSGTLSHSWTAAGEYRVRGRARSQPRPGRESNWSGDLLVVVFDPPVVTTAAVSGITSTSAVFGGEVTHQGSADVTVCGVCWGMSANPTLQDEHTEQAHGAGAFSRMTTGLAPDTVYHTRAYATTVFGTVYGDNIAFSTRRIQTTSFAPPANRTYGDADFAPGATSSSGLPVSYASSDLSVAVVVGESIRITGTGSVVITALQPGDAFWDEAPPVERTLMVGKRTLTVAAKDTSRSYGNANPAFFTVTYDGFVNGDDEGDLTAQPTAICAADAASGVGNYDIVSAGGADENYAFAYADGTLTVTPKRLTVLAENTSRLYGDINPAFTVTCDGFVNGEDNSVLDGVPAATCDVDTNSPAGVYDIVPAGGAAANYSFVYTSGKLTVEPAPLLAAASNKMRAEGAGNPPLTFFYCGLRNADTRPAVEPNIVCEADASSPPGLYPIVLTGGSDPNYMLTLADGMLLVYDRLGAGFDIAVDGGDASPTVLWFGETGEATNDFDNVWDAVADTGHFARLFCPLVSVPESRHLARDFRPIPAGQLTRWRLEVSYVQTRGAVTLTWDVEAAAAGREVWLQELADERPVGFPVDMKARNELPGVAPGTAFEIVYGALQTHEIALRRGWNAVGTPLLGLQTLGQLAGRRGDGEIGFPAWRWGAGGFERIDADAPFLPETGYLVRCVAESATLSVIGLPPDGVFPLGPGWHLISPVAAMTPPTVRAGGPAAWRWNVDSQSHRMADAFVPGEAYWWHGDGTTGDEPAAGELLKSTRGRDLSPDAGDIEALVAGNTAFAIDLYHQWRGEDGNLFLSPHSISTALGMTYAGARGETAAQMATALRFGLPDDRLHAAFNALDLELASRGEGAAGSDGQPFRLRVVNQLWGERTYSFLAPFLDTLAEHYGAGLRAMDFVGAADPARLAINDWVAFQTEQRIRNLLPQGSITSLTRLVLTNAVYFNAAWQSPFPAANSSPGPFTRLDGTQAQAPMMRQTANFPAQVGANWTAVELPYDGGELSMLLLVPDPGAFADFEQNLTAARLNAVLASLGPRLVDLALPKFEYSCQASIKAFLAQLGMPVAFSEAADFSGMDGTRELLISDVVHQAFVKVDEKGTEAAAATGVVVGVTSVPEPLTLTVDRPFLFLIRDRATGAVLFIGRVLDPGR